MTDHRSRLGARGSWRFLARTLTLAISLGLSAEAPERGRQAAEAWTVLVQTGDELATGRPPAAPNGTPLTARTAYLLAFHEAQDGGDVEHVLAVADRLDAAGEPHLAAHVRRAAVPLAVELSR